MASVTAFTAARMLIIENTTIVDGDVVGNNLILKRRDLVEIDAGNVRGPTGSPGVTSGELNAFLLNSNPVGSVIDYIGTTPPTNWTFMTGQTIVDGQTLYPALWAILPASMKSGSSIIMPDTRGRMAIGLDVSNPSYNAIGETGGSATHQLTAAELPTHTHVAPSHTHDMSHDHAAITSDPAGAHTHNVMSDNSTWHVSNFAALGTTNGNLNAYGPQGSVGTNTAIAISAGTHSHNVNVANYVGSTGGTVGGGLATSSVGSDQAHNNLPPYVALLKIIKLV